MLVAVFAGLSGCGESGYDIYLKGAVIEGEAERGPCKLHYTQASQAAPLSGNPVATCLKETEKALAYYEQAAATGYREPDFIRVLERARERKQRLESMLGMVRAMEREQMGMPPAPADRLGHAPGEPGPE
jgi:hypothetical protein